MALDFQPATLVAYSTNAGLQSGPNRMLKVGPNQVITLRNSTAQSFYEALGYVRLADLELKDGSKLCQYELKLRSR